MQLPDHSKIIYADAKWEIWKQSARTFYLRRYDSILRAMVKIKCPKNSFYLKIIGE